MAEFQVLVPNDRKVESVMGDGETAALMVTITPPEAEFSAKPIRFQVRCLLA